MIVQVPLSCFAHYMITIFNFTSGQGLLLRTYSGLQTGRIHKERIGARRVTTF